MSHEYRDFGNTRVSALVLFGALALSGLCLLLGILAGPQAVIWRYLLVALGAFIAGVALVWLGACENGNWWILPCAAVCLGMALSLGLKMIIPSASTFFIIGVVLAAGGLGLSFVITNPRSPHILLTVDGLVLFLALLLVLSGIGYAFNLISLAFVAIGFSLAIAALYFPIVLLYVMAGVLAALGFLCAPNPQSGLRLLLPALLIIGGLTLLWYSQPDRTLV